MNIEAVKQQIKGVDLARVFSLDLNGMPITLQVNPDNIESIIENGIGFDGSSIAGMGTVQDSDKLLVPDPETFRVVEFADDKVGFIIGKVHDTRQVRSGTDSRAVLEKVLDRARTKHGCTFLAGPEHEFFLLTGDRFNSRIHTDNAGYFHCEPHDKGDAVRKTIVKVLSKCGVRFEKTHHEVTASQHEVSLECLEPLEAADRTVLFNYVTRKVAHEFGYHATFMSKPFDGQNRNAFHIHLSMQDLAGKNLFYDAEDGHNLSKTARQFIGGIIKYARQTSIIMASTHNSYKAYVLQREAPVVRGWGLRNRSSMVRVPYAIGPEATRIELRNPDPAGNVYLQMAVLIGMGLAGIAEDLDCGEPDVGSAYDRTDGGVWDEGSLPKCMFEALVEAERSTFLRELLGEKMYDGYMRLKRADWEDHRTHVTAREHDKYLSR